MPIESIIIGFIVGFALVLIIRAGVRSGLADYKRDEAESGSRVKVRGARDIRDRQIQIEKNKKLKEFREKLKAKNDSREN